MRKKIVAVILLILVLIVAALAVTAAMAFRTKPVLESGDTYSIPQCSVWTDGPNDDFEGREFFVPDQSQTEAVLTALAGHEKKLLSERLFDGIRAKYLLQGIPVEVPDWVEADMFLLDEDTDRMDHIVFGNGHVQIRLDHTYLPPYYEIDGAEELCEALLAALQVNVPPAQP